METIIMQDITYIDKMRCSTYVEHDVFFMLNGEPNAFMVYFTLKMLHNKEWGYACPSVIHSKTSSSEGKGKDLVTLTGMSENPVRKALKLLESMGLIRTEKVKAKTGNRKILFYIYQPISVKESDLDMIKEDLDNKKAFVATNYKDSK